jgi:spore maturation protein CgeB
MIINFVANYQSGYVGEVADETHIARELEALGHTVRKIPRDAWREYVIENFPEGKYDVPTEFKADLNLIAKWHHFYDGQFIEKLREKSGAPVFYWVWDYMDDGGFPEWHTKAVEACDLYLSNEGGISHKYGSKFYYFPFDNSDEQIDKVVSTEYHYDVAFFGSYLHQGDRIEILKHIKQTYPITVFSWNWEDWKKDGFETKPAVYGKDFTVETARSKIILGVNVNDHCWGYWSNRVGKVLTVGGFLLQRYVPGMELFLRDGAAYFNTKEEAVEKITYYLEHEDERKAIADRGYQIGRDRFTSKARVTDLSILIERWFHGREQIVFAS